MSVQIYDANGNAYEADLVDGDKYRQLERENAELSLLARKRMEELIRVYPERKQLRTENERLERENAALREAAMKLIENNGGPIQSEKAEAGNIMDDYVRVRFGDFEALMLAIDAARKEQP